MQNAGRSGPVQLPRISTNQRRNNKKGSQIRLAQAHSAMSRLTMLWKNNNISFSTKIKLYKLLVLLTLLNGCESWTLTADLERRILAFENKCYRRMLAISYREHKTNEYVWQPVDILARR